MLGYDWSKGASAMTAALAEGLAEGATRQRALAASTAPTSSPSPSPPPAPPSKKQGSFWTDPLVGPVPGWGVVAGGAVAAALLVRLL